MKEYLKGELMRKFFIWLTANMQLSNSQEVKNEIATICHKKIEARL